MGNGQSDPSGAIVAIDPASAHIVRRDGRARRVSESGSVGGHSGLGGLGSVGGGSNGQGAARPKAKVLPPPNHSSQNKQTNFAWYKPGWEAYLDEQGNIYYFNATLQQTKWDPFAPSEEEAQMMQQQGYSQGDENGAFFGDGGDEHATLKHQPTWNMFDDFAARKEEAERRRRLMQQRADRIRTDKLAAWKELADEGKLDVHLVEQRVAAADDVISQVSQGLYDPQVVYQLPWAYKMSQLGAAVKDCFLECGQFSDSSKYDDCNGVPRYSEGGLFAWWTDLEREYAEVRGTLASGIAGKESAHYSEAMQILQNITSSGSEDDILKGFVARLKEVETEINNLRARCFAIVSVEGGPSRESLDTLYRYLKENVKNDTNLADIQDEMEEVISNALEQRHRFMVDILLLMGLLEDECDTLNRRILNFQNANAADSSDSEDDSGDSEEEEEGGGAGGESDPKQEDAPTIDPDSSNTEADVPAVDISSIESAISDVITNQIIPQGMSELLQNHQRDEAKLRDTLDNNRSKQTKRLEERLKKREQDRLARLQAQGMSKKEAELLVAAEIDEERGAEEENIAKDAADEQMAFALTALKELVDKSSQEAAALETDMAAEMDRRRAQIRREVEEAMRNRERQIMLEQGLSAKAARALLQEEEDALIEQKESEAEQAILQEVEERRTAMLHTIRLAHEREQARVDEANRMLHDMQKKALQLKLEGRKKLRVHELTKKNMSLEEATKIANDEAERELRLAEKTIAKATDTNVLTTKAKIVESMKEAHERETHRLAEDLKHVEERRKVALQARLEDREKRRAKALQAEGMSESKAQSLAKEEMEKTQVEARAALEEEIKVKREAHIKEAERLMDVMTTKKETASKDLQERLAKRKAQNVAKAAEVEAKPKETPAQKLDKYLKQLREAHRHSINRLNQFVSAQKKVAIRKAEALDALGDTPGGDLSSRLAEISALFSVVKDGLQTGFRKQCVYEIRAVKESNNLRPLSSDERRMAIRDGTSQLMMRYGREMKSLFELQLAEKHRARQKLVEDGAPPSKLLTLESRFEARILENICKQQNKALTSLCGLVLDVSLLEPPSGVKVDMSAGSTKAVSVEAAGDDDDAEALGTGEQSDGENDFENTFDTNVMAWFQGVIQLQQMYIKPPNAIVHRFNGALNQIVAAVEEYNHSDKSVAANFKKDDVESAIGVYCASGSILLKILLEAFLPHISEVCDFPLTSEAQIALMKKSISSIAASSDNQKALDAANKSKSAQEKVRLLFGTEAKYFLEDPFADVDPKQTGAGTRSHDASTDRRGGGGSDDLRRREDQLMKALESKLEKKRKETHDYFRRSKESRAADLNASGGVAVVGVEQTEQEFATMEAETLNRLNEAFEEIRGMVFTGSASNMELLNLLSAEGLMAAIENRLEGNDITARDLKTIQVEVEKDLERKEATRLRKAQSAEAEKLDVMLKVQRAREQQALQKRLLARKNKKTGNGGE